MPVETVKGYSSVGSEEPIFILKSEAFWHALHMCVNGPEKDMKWFEDCFLPAFPDFINELERCYYSNGDWTVKEIEEDIHDGKCN